MASATEAAATPTCVLLHDLLNKLTAIQAECELLQPELTLYSASKRVRAIQNLTAEMAESLIRHQCTLGTVVRDLVDLFH